MSLNKLVALSLWYSYVKNHLLAQGLWRKLFLAQFHWGPFWIYSNCIYFNSHWHCIQVVWHYETPNASNYFKLNIGHTRQNIAKTRFGAISMAAILDLWKLGLLQKYVFGFRWFIIIKYVMLAIFFHKNIASTRQNIVKTSFGAFSVAAILFMQISII